MRELLLERRYAPVREYPSWLDWTEQGLLGFWSNTYAQVCWGGIPEINAENIRTGILVGDVDRPDARAFGECEDAFPIYMMLIVRFLTGSDVQHAMGAIPDGSIKVPSLEQHDKHLVLQILHYCSSACVISVLRSSTWRGKWGGNPTIRSCSTSSIGIIFLSDP